MCVCVCVCVSMLANGGIYLQEKHNITINKPVNTSLYVYALWNSVCNLYLLSRKDLFQRTNSFWSQTPKRKKKLNSQWHTRVIRRWPGGMSDTKSNLFRRVTCPIDYRRPADWACRDIKKRQDGDREAKNRRVKAVIASEITSSLTQ